MDHLSSRNWIVVAMRAVVAVAFIVCALLLGRDCWAPTASMTKVTKHDGSSPDAFIVDIINLLLPMSKRVLWC